MADLSGKTVAIVVDNYFEEDEFTGPLKALKGAGVTVDVIASSAEDGQVQAMQGDTDKSEKYDVDKSLDEANVNDYDALILPGGVVNADNLRTEEKACAWAKQFLEEGKPVAAICHAPWVLASADVIRGKKLTSFSSLRDDLKNAGADWVDQEVVVDGNLITSRKPDDVPAFNEAIISALEAA